MALKDIIQTTTITPFLVFFLSYLFFYLSFLHPSRTSLSSPDTEGKVIVADQGLMEKGEGGMIRWVRGCRREGKGRVGGTGGYRRWEEVTGT